VILERVHKAGNGFHCGGEAINRGSTDFMNGLHLSGDKAGIEEDILLNFSKTASAPTKKALH
jgi:hypothetical protein